MPLQFQPRVPPHNVPYSCHDHPRGPRVHKIRLSTTSPSGCYAMQVNIYCDCPLWPDDSMCALQACSVCECEPSEVPQPWLAAEKKSCTAGIDKAEPGKACNSNQCEHVALAVGMGWTIGGGGDRTTQIPLPTHVPASFLGSYCWSAWPR